MRTRHVYVRPVRPDESQMFFDWAKENPAGEFDERVPLFPSSTTWCAYDKDGPLVFQTLQRPIMLESLAPRPGATKEQIALSMKELTQNAITQANILGVGEIYYLGSDEGTDLLSTNQIFEKLPFSAYRLKLGDLCA